MSIPHGPCPAILWFTPRKHRRRSELSAEALQDLSDLTEAVACADTQPSMDVTRDYLNMFNTGSEWLTCIDYCDYYDY